MIRSSLLLALLALCCAEALADPGYYMVTIYDDPGVRTADFRYCTFKPEGGRTTTWPEVGLGWNVNGRWYTELLASYIGSADSGTRLSTLNWQNDLLLTRGQYPLDLAIHTLLVRDQNPAHGGAIEFGPALQTDFDRTQANLNLIFERAYGEAAEQPTQLKYQWQLRYRWRPWLHAGAQGFGEVGPWRDWSPRADQSHRLGPAIFGSLPLTSGLLGWQAALLTGSTYGQHGRMFTMRVKLDF